MSVGEGQSVRWWTAVGAIALAGLALRVAAAGGGLWTDEAWSVIYAARAGDAAGVFFRINHDNNHHLYSLWLQAVGANASPLAARALAIVAGALSIPAAALAFARRSPRTGIVAAILFAVSPTMVNFGSEARGYSLMLLAALVMLWLAVEAVDGHEKRRTPWLAGLASLVGTLSHMTMAAPVALIGLWIYLEYRRASGPMIAMRQTVRLMAPAFAACIGVIIFVFAAASASPTGMQVGGYVPFSWPTFVAALDDLTAWTVGLTFVQAWAAPAVVAGVALWVAIRRPPWLGPRARLYGLMILAVPLGVALVQSGNSSFARYYLTSAVGLLLLASEWLGRGLALKGVARAGAAALLIVATTASLWRDRQLIELQRGRPDAPLGVIARQSPTGARVALDPKRMEGVLRVAAIRADYPLHIVRACARFEYVLAAPARPGGVLPHAIARCGLQMRALAWSKTSTLTGDAWVLYGVERLQTARAPVSGRAPAASDRRFSGRAGVAQG